MFTLEKVEIPEDSLIQYIEERLFLQKSMKFTFQQNANMFMMVCALIIRL